MSKRLYKRGSSYNDENEKVGLPGNTDLLFSLVKADSVDRILTPTSGSPHPVWTSTNGRFRDYQKKKHALLILTNIHLVFFSTVMFTLTNCVAAESSLSS